MRQWAGKNEAGKPWAPSWEPPDHCTDGLLNEWEERIRRLVVDTKTAQKRRRSTTATSRRTSSRHSKSTSKNDAASPEHKRQRREEEEVKSEDDLPPSKPRTRYKLAEYDPILPVEPSGLRSKSSTSSLPLRAPSPDSDSPRPRPRPRLRPKPRRGSDSDSDCSLPIGAAVKGDVKDKAGEEESQQMKFGPPRGKRRLPQKSTLSSSSAQHPAPAGGASRTPASHTSTPAPASPIKPDADSHASAFAREALVAPVSALTSAIRAHEHIHPHASYRAAIRYTDPAAVPLEEEEGLQSAGPSSLGIVLPTVTATGVRTMSDSIPGHPMPDGGRARKKAAPGASSRALAGPSTNANHTRPPNAVAGPSRAVPQFNSAPPLKSLASSQGYAAEDAQSISRRRDGPQNNLSPVYAGSPSTRSSPCPSPRMISSYDRRSDRNTSEPDATSTISKVGPPALEKVEEKLTPVSARDLTLAPHPEILVVPDPTPASVTLEHNEVSLDEDNTWKMDTHSSSSSQASPSRTQSRPPYASARITELEATLIAVRESANTALRQEKERTATALRDADILRDRYAQASAFVKKTRAENEVLIQRAEIAESQANEDLKSGCAQAAAQQKALEDEVTMLRTTNQLLVARTAWADDGAHEPVTLEWRRQIERLEKRYELRDEEANEALRKVNRLKRQLADANEEVERVEEVVAKLRAAAMAGVGGGQGKDKAKLEPQEQADVE